MPGPDDVFFPRRLEIDRVGDSGLKEALEKGEIIFVPDSRKSVYGPTTAHFIEGVISEALETEIQLPPTLED